MTVQWVRACVSGLTWAWEAALKGQHHPEEGEEGGERAQGGKSSGYFFAVHY